MQKYIRKVVETHQNVRDVVVPSQVRDLALDDQLLDWTRRAHRNDLDGVVTELQGAVGLLYVLNISNKVTLATLLLEKNLTHYRYLL